MLGRLLVGDLIWQRRQCLCPGPATTMAPAASLSHRLWHHRGWSAAGLYEGPCSRYSRSPAHGDNSYCHGFSAQSKLCHSAPDAARWPAVLLQHHGADHARASLVLVMGTTRPTGHCRHLARRLPEMALSCELCQTSYPLPALPCISLQPLARYILCCALSGPWPWPGSVPRSRHLSLACAPAVSLLAVFVTATAASTTGIYLPF